MILFKFLNKVFYNIYKASGKLKCILYKITLGENVSVIGNPIISRSENDEIKIGSDSSLISKSKYTALGVNKPVILRTLYTNAKIIIGKDCGLSGTVICSAEEIKIGNNCLIGADVVITDTDFHSIQPENRRYERRKEKINHGRVKIGNNVFIGTKSIVMKNVEIGDNSVIGAGSVVTKSIPANVIAAGNPAVVIKSLLRKEKEYDLDLHTCI
jgi:acetyltransferase-like isoleucine patch superfamily enzyme